MKNAEKQAFGYGIANNNGFREEKGLTKREYFAGLAMQGLLSNNHPYFYGNRDGETTKFVIADEAIRLADELLTQLTTSISQ